MSIPVAVCIHKSHSLSINSDVSKNIYPKSAYLIDIYGHPYLTLHRIYRSTAITSRVVARLFPHNSRNSIRTRSHRVFELLCEVNRMRNGQWPNEPFKNLLVDHLNDGLYTLNGRFMVDHKTIEFVRFIQGFPAATGLGISTRNISTIRENALVYTWTMMT